MLVEAFDFSLKHQCERGLVVMAKCKRVYDLILIVYVVDGKHYSIASATTGGKVLIHSPLSNNGAAADLPAIKTSGG